MKEIKYLIDKPSRLFTENIYTNINADQVFSRFESWVEFNGAKLYKEQEEALIELISGSHVILSTPTGSGKSLVAVGAIYNSLTSGIRSYYTAPIKALVNEKFFALCNIFGPKNVGILTGEASVNVDAPIIICTAEILGNLTLQKGGLGNLGREKNMIVMDEFHYYGDPNRGWAWQVPLLELINSQFLLMSATLGDVSFLRSDLTRRTGKPTALVIKDQRPVPLSYSYATTPMHETITKLLKSEKSPIYVVHFTQSLAIERAQSLMSVKISTKKEMESIANAITGFYFSTAFGSILSRLVRHGIGIHHAGMLPKYRRLIEQLAKLGLLKVICGTDTLGIGINVPFRTVIFSSLIKYDGKKMRLLNVREFHQISGRAGRAGYDIKGNVIIQAPDYEVEKIKQFSKTAALNFNNKRKIVKNKLVSIGKTSWSENTMQRLIASSPETLISSMRISTAMILDVFNRPGDSCIAMKKLLTDNHESRKRKLIHVRVSIGIVRLLIQTGVLEYLNNSNEYGSFYRLTVDLPSNFSLSRPLSTFALAAVEILDIEKENYALDVVSIIEATLEDPNPVLIAQKNKAKSKAIFQMKNLGLNYDKYIELIEEVSYPKPLAEILKHAYYAYQQSNPWVSDGKLSPKSVVREMWENAMTFREFISFYGLSRHEGTLLRYLSNAFKALNSGIPSNARTERLSEIVEWIGELIRQVDYSLIYEWEQLNSSNCYYKIPNNLNAISSPSLVDNKRVFIMMIRNTLFYRIELFSFSNWNDLGTLDEKSGWTAARWARVGKMYYTEHNEVRTGQNSRSLDLVIIKYEPLFWHVRQIIDDPSSNHDWEFNAEVDITASNKEGIVVLNILEVGQVIDIKSI